MTTESIVLIFAAPPSPSLFQVITPPCLTTLAKTNAFKPLSVFLADMSGVFPGLSASILFSLPLDIEK
jgi:hypothetical protein